MKQYRGGVFFVDILGIGSLTRGHVVLTDHDYDTYKIRKNKSVYTLCAKILIKFRKILNSIRMRYQSVKVAQLSDCAFIWSEDPLELIEVTRQLMWDTVCAGILCRGGLAYGEIVEPNKVNNSLGEFVLGEAVTKAVDIEGAGKGCRVFCDVSFPTEVSSEMRFKDEPFVGLKNPADCSIVDEFKWYKYPGNMYEYNCMEKKEKEITTGLVKLVSHLRYSPYFRWNISSHQGEIQVASSIEAISSCVSQYVNGFDYKMPSESLVGFLDNKRSNEIQKDIFNLTKSDMADYFK